MSNEMEPTDVYEHVKTTKTMDPQVLDQNTDLILRFLYKDVKSDSKMSPVPVRLTRSRSKDISLKPTISQEKQEARTKFEANPPSDTGELKDDDALENVKPCPSFDENSQIVLIFSVHAETQLDEDVFITGSTSDLGEWDPNRAIKLTTDAYAYPSWKAFLITDSTSRVLEYKYLIRDKYGKYNKWEEFTENRKFSLTRDIYNYIDDGHFNKLTDSVVNNNQTILRLREEIQVRDRSISERDLEVDKLKKDLESMREKFREMETLISQLKKRLDIYEGNRLDLLTNNDLKSLSLKSKKTAHQAKVVLTKRLEDEAYHLKRLKDCAVCMDNVIDTVYLPCGHLAVCAGCATKLGPRCVICNSKAQKIHKVVLQV